MSDITLATRYAAENYPGALNNLAKRYRRKEDGEAIHYSELGFGDVSEEQAKVVLRFFADIDLLDNPKGANYIPPESLIDWQLKMGDVSEKGKKQVHDKLMEYGVFNETVFILEEGDEKLSDLAEQVGGMVGIDEDELSEMEKTIEVFVECGFLDIDDENVVSLPEDMQDGSPDSPDDTTSNASTDVSNVENSSSHSSPQSQTDSDSEARSVSATVDSNHKHLTTDLELSIDATEMEPQDLKEKLQIIEEVVGYDGE